jgi:hypothetical protein
MPASVQATLQTPGRPLEAPVRAAAERRFGYSFERLRVHTDGRAADSAEAIGALAYTVGEHVVFGRGRYDPATTAGQRLLAHELAHAAQQRLGSGAASQAPQARGVARVDDPLEREAEAAAEGNPIRSHAPPDRLYAYRPKGKDTIHFGKGDTAALTEESFTDPKKQPWIESIEIRFDGVATDTGHVADAKAAGEPDPRMPTGTLVAKYHDGKLPDVTVSIVGGSTMASIGLTDHVKNATVKRLEGSGYTDSQNIQLGNLTDPVAKKGHGARYSKSGAGTMNYAIFFKGIQAIHEGSLNIGSHACVHVEATETIKQLNYHSVIGRTKVTVAYDSSVLHNLCCHRRTSGNPHWNRNPCGGIKASSCP